MKFELTRVALEDMLVTNQDLLRKIKRVEAELQRLRSDLADREAQVDRLRSQASDW